MATYYAWSNFPVEKNEWGQPTKTIQVGEKVSQSDLGVSDEEWDALIESGAVSEEEYPDIPDNVSPAEHEKQEMYQEAALTEMQAKIDEQKEQAKQSAKDDAKEEASSSSAQKPGTGSTASNKG